MGQLDRPDAEAEANTSQPLRLLYVEDNRISVLLFEEAMRDHATIELRIAEDGEQAIAMALDWRPDVLVLDAHLPDTNGFDLLPRLLALPGLAATPAFMCSADTHPEDVQRARTVGFSGYWPKPVERALVLTELGQLSGKASAP